MPALLDEQVELDELPELSDGGEPPDYFDSDDHDDDDGDGEPIRWTTVATYWNPTEAHIARLKLESEEIDCLLIDENIVATQWIWAGAVGGVKLQVPEEDLIRARELLTSNQNITNDEPPAEGQAKCPQCGSGDIHTLRLSRKIAIVTLLVLGLPLPFLQRRQHCAACGFEWKTQP